MRILTSVSRRHSSLSVLGAGNLNDLRLDELQQLYAEVHLVDIDVEAMRAGLSREGLERSQSTHLHGPIDLTGVLDRLPVRGSAQEAVGSLLRLLARHRCQIEGGPFDVTVSAGALTQLLQSVVDSAMAQRDVERVSLALRDKHIADLVDLTRPDGTLVLITDVVSTATAPDLLGTDPSELEDRMAELVAARNFFTGANPYRIVGLLEEDVRFRHRVSDVALVEPWLWHVTPDRQHLTCAIVAIRSRG